MRLGRKRDAKGGEAGRNAGAGSGGPNGSLGQAGTSEQRHIAEALAELTETSAREVMTPRIDVVALPIPVRFADVLAGIRRTGHTRFPVYDEDLDNLVGILFVKDLLRDNRWWTKLGGPPVEESAERAAGTTAAARPHDGGAPDDPDTGRIPTSFPALDEFGPLDISRRLRPPYIVPETRNALDLLAEMRRQRRGFAVVVDEFGSVSGVLTIKDIVSRLVGDIPDEFDSPEPPPIMRVDGLRWLVEGTCPVDQVRKELGMPLPDGQYVTLGGFLADALGEIPHEGQEVEVGVWILRVIEMERRRVAQVVVQAAERDTDTHDAASGQ